MISIRFLACVLVAGAALLGCASKPAATPTSEVPLYLTTQLVPSQYSVVERLWTDSWHSNITYPSFGSAEAGLQALKRDAAAEGAGGLLNVMCLDARGWQNGKLLCYGDAIKFN
jgi:hypothetical protein